jgi:hypothetical protein
MRCRALALECSHKPLKFQSTEIANSRRLSGIIRAISLSGRYAFLSHVTKFESDANGGFMLARGFSAPGNLQKFVDLVVPELQRRSLSKKKYVGPTLRDNLLN